MVGLVELGSYLLRLARIFLTVLPYVKTIGTLRLLVHPLLGVVFSVERPTQDSLGEFRGVHLCLLIAVGFAYIKLALDQFNLQELVSHVVPFL